MQSVPIRVHCPHCGFCHDGMIGDGELREKAA
jgi:hypothetical protein